MLLIYYEPQPALLSHTHTNNFLQVSNLESMMGASPSSSTPVASTGRKHGIDVVLGAQWGDEGKGKLVDLLSQVCIS
jgi:hypothetical protein